MNVLSLFDGISCGQMTFKKLNINIDKYYSSEIDSVSIAITNNNFPNTIQIGDVTLIDLGKIEKIDMLIGGSPCQGFSNLGKGLGFNDDRSKLFWEYVKILNKTKPEYFFLENIVMKKEFVDIISSELGVEPTKINSKLHSPTSRNRLYWTNIIDFEIKQNDITFDDVFEKNNCENVWFTNDRINKMKNWKAYRNPLDYPLVYGKKQKIPCLVARGYNNYHRNSILVKEGDKFRYLSHLEAERSMGLPDNYTKYKEDIETKDSERSRCIGNAWNVYTIENIFGALL